MKLVRAMAIVLAMILAVTLDIVALFEPEYVLAENAGDESTKVILPVDEKEWNLLYKSQMLEDCIVEAHTGNIIEKKGYVALTFININEDGVCALYLPDGNNVHIVYYDRSQRYIGGEIVSAPVGKLLELSKDCVYLTVSMAEDEIENSLLAQEDVGTVKIVAEEGTGYSSIKKAVAAIKESGVVVVLPGTYVGNVQAWGKNVTMIGTDRNSCFLENNSGSYSLPPLEMGAGSICNMTIRTSGGITPVDKAGAYGVHVEDNGLYNNNLVIENCTIESEHNSGLGMGMRGGCNVQLKNVTLKGRDYGLFCHDSAYSKYTGEQNLSMIKCVVEGSRDEGAVRFDSQGVKGARINLLFVDNYLKNDNNQGIKNLDGLISTRNMYGKGSEENWMGLKNYYLREESMGNNLSRLDY